MFNTKEQKNQSVGCVMQRNRRTSQFDVEYKGTEELVSWMFNTKEQKNQSVGCLIQRNRRTSQLDVQTQRISSFTYRCSNAEYRRLQLDVQIQKNIKHNIWMFKYRGTVGFAVGCSNEK